MHRFIYSCMAVCLLGSNTNAQLPFKYDSLYKTIYAKDLCRLLQKTPDLLLVDVRTAGEYSDTSQYASLNLGHLKGAINIEIEGMKKNMDTIGRYKNRTIVFYCSHSQRSRRVSRLLTENGFTNFYNLNGGMTVLNQLNENDFPCKKDWVVSGLSFKNLSFNESALLIKNEKELIVIDVRPAAQFNSADTLAELNVGRIKKAINIPYDEFKQRTNELMKYKEQPILVYTSSGDGDGARAAADLMNNGFKTVYQLLGGINGFIASEPDISCIENTTPYTLTDAYRTLLLLQKNSGLVIYDTRPDDEYDNRLTGMISYRNLGRMKNAVHVQEANFSSQSLPADKNVPVLIYGHEASFKFAALLSGKGYKQVYLLDSFYDFVWSGFNIEGCKMAKNYIVNHEGLY